jgi:hypothetical protein
MIITSKALSQLISTKISNIIFKQLKLYDKNDLSIGVGWIYWRVLFINMHNSRICINSYLDLGCFFHICHCKLTGKPRCSVYSPHVWPYNINGNFLWDLGYEYLSYHGKLLFIEVRFLCEVIEVGFGVRLEQVTCIAIGLFLQELGFN